MENKIINEMLTQSQEQQTAKREYRQWLVEHNCTLIIPTYWHGRAIASKPSFPTYQTYQKRNIKSGTEIVTELQALFNMKDGRSRTSKFDYTYVMGNLNYYYRGGKVNIRAYEMSNGIIWAYQTGRLTYEAETAILNMNALAFVRLIGETCDNCTVQNDIPKWLNSKLG